MQQIDVQGRRAQHFVMSKGEDRRALRAEAYRYATTSIALEGFTAYDPNEELAYAAWVDGRIDDNELERRILKVVKRHGNCYSG